MDLLNKWVLNKGETKEDDMLSKIYKGGTPEYKSVTWMRGGLIFCEWQDEEFFEGCIDVTDICLRYLEIEELDADDFVQENAFEVFEILDCVYDF